MRRAAAVNTFVFSPETRDARRFFLDLGPYEQGPLAVAAGGWEACSPDYLVERSGFPYFSLELVTHGKGMVDLAGHPHALVAGSVFSYGPGVDHRIRSDRADLLEKYFVDFRGREAVALLDSAGFPPGSCGAVMGAARLIALFEELIGFGTHPHALARNGAVLSLRLLMVVLAQQRTEPGGTGSAHATLNRCQAYMQQHFLRLRTVEEVAAACHIDAAYLCRLYRRFLGQTPYRCLQRLQIGWAAERLLDTGRNVGEVADELGCDPFQFSRTFKRIYGVAPRAFVKARNG